MNAAIRKEEFFPATRYEPEGRTGKSHWQKKVLTPEVFSFSTANLIIDLPRFDDISDIIFHTSCPQIARMLPLLPHPFSDSDAHRFIQMGTAGQDGACARAIRLGCTGRLIGGIKLRALEKTPAIAIAFWIGEAFQKKGYASEAILELSNQLFAHNYIDAIVTQIPEDNAAGARVLRKCTYDHVGSDIIKDRRRQRPVAFSRFALERAAWSTPTRSCVA